MAHTAWIRVPPVESGLLAGSGRLDVADLELVASEANRVVRWHLLEAWNAKLIEVLAEMRLGIPYALQQFVTR